MTFDIQKPFLKWVGGKTQIIDRVLDKISENSIINYHEPFVGGGSVLFGVLSLKQQGRIDIKGDIYASDLNKTLIDTYKHIQQQPNELKKVFSKYTKEYDEGDSKEYYYQARKLFNSGLLSPIDRSAVFMMLNKSCFRGLYREGPNGFNVPFGHYKKVTWLSDSEIDKISYLLQGVKFECIGFDKALEKVQCGDLVYADPPYAPESAKSFVNYTSKGFDETCHKQLFGMLNAVDEKGGRIVLSNSDVDFVKDHFKKCKCDVIVARRAINSKKPGSKTNEVLIYN